MPGWPGCGQKLVCERKEECEGEKLLSGHSRRETVGESGMAVMDKEGRDLIMGMEGQSCWAFAISRLEKGKGEKGRKRRKGNKADGRNGRTRTGKDIPTTKSDSGRQGSWLDRNVGSCWRRRVGS
jgi:hypothetical protein